MPILVAILILATADEPPHWSFRPPVRPEIPAVRGGDWVRTPVDAFVLATLEFMGLKPAPEADRATLLRRLSVDLTGLPPTPEEVDAFVRDPAPDAYEKQVDRLLASPRYGERSAQFWLDLARYADTDGFEYDAARPDAWRYRDWVVKAFNSDMPFDRFVRLQTAGDEAEPGDPDAAVATGFHRAYPDMVDQNDQGLRRQNALDDITETTGLAFLGLTIGCAKCHDHKTDPISQRDFYALQAFFTPARFRDDFPIASPGSRRDFESKMKAWRSALAAARARLIAAEAAAREALAPGRPPGLDDTTVAAFQTPVGERTPEQVALIFDALVKDKRIRKDAIDKALDDDGRRVRRDALAAVDGLMTSAPAPLPKARILDEAGGNPPPTFLRRRGDFSQPGPEVAPAFPAVLATAGPEFRPSPTSSGRRSALADWLTRPDHPLTARVMVNRLWQRHFGRGLVATPSDFGMTGEAPSHPELLDWLATALVDRGGSFKAIHRLIVTSAAYRQSSRFDAEAAKVDPDNALVWRHSRRRLDAEALRDALLSVSGRLNLAMGGPSVFPEMPAELVTNPDLWPVSRRPEERDRRSLYVFVRRNLRYPFFESFDRPDPNASCPKRAASTTAPQALNLLNGRLGTESARALAGRVRREAGSGAEGQVDRAYRLALGRPPNDRERGLALAFLDGDAALEQFCLALLNLNEFVYVD